MHRYLCLTAHFGAQDVAPPPPHHIRVGYAWATTPNEESEAYGQDARGDMIAIPLGYRPVDMTALVSAHPGDPTATVPADVFMAIGGEVVVTMVDESYGQSGQPAGTAPDDGPAEIAFGPALTWPGGVPVVVRAVGHWDNTLVTEATIRCARTEEALDAWRLRTWEQLRAAHELRMQAYRTELEEQALRAFGDAPVERPQAENRRIEAEELRKWAIKAMRLESFFFDGIEPVLGLQEVDPVDGDLQATVARFFEEAFEWPQASYFLYPYYWARRDTWALRAQVEALDPRHAAFMRAGAARFIVPVTPGYEDRVVFYLNSEADELDRLAGPPQDYHPDDSALEELWLELLLDRRPELAHGSGTLTVQQGSPMVQLNADSTWDVGERDVGRELFIDGDRYVISDVTSADAFVLDEQFKGASNPAASYATGSVPYGPPWVTRVPTSLVILNGRRPDLAQLTF